MENFNNPMYGRPCIGRTIGVLSKDGTMWQDDVTGTFVALGTDYDGPATFTVAILETAGGALRPCVLDGFRFLDKGESA